MAQGMLKVSRLAGIRIPATPSVAYYHNKARIGNRDVVGFGINGEAAYHDLTNFPMPAIRFRENTTDVMALREKEKGDWRKLSLEDKKALYRASFCQTYAEMKAPTGVWKPIIAGVFVGVSLTMWVYLWLKRFVYSPLPESFSAESREAQLKRMIDMRVNPIDGLASHWDYEKGRWKE